MAKKTYLCPSCKKALAFEKTSDEQMIVCPVCQFQGQGSQFSEIVYRKIYCPSCKTGLQVSSLHQGVVKCPQCGFSDDVARYPTTPPLSSASQQPELQGEATVLPDSLKKTDRQQNLGCLVLIEGDCRPARIVLKAGKNTLGRKSQSSSSSIQLETNDGYMSKNHALIEVATKTNGSLEYLLSDNGSSNGTFHNEERIESGDVMLLKQGDTVRLGHTTYRFTFED